MIFEAESVQSFLMQEFNRRLRINPRYSLRAYSRLLGMSSGALSEILRSRRPVSMKVATKIARSLGLDVIETKRLLDLLDTERRQALTDPSLPTPASLEQKQLDEDSFQLVSEWYHFAILNLLDCEDFKWDAKFIAKRLGLTLTQSQMAMNLLLRLGLVKQERGHIKSARDYVLAPAGLSSSAIRKYHQQILTKSMEALELQNINERDVSGVGFAVNPVYLPEIKREISDFQDRLVTKYSKGKKQEVYFFEAVLFRLTQGRYNESN